MEKLVKLLNQILLALRDLEAVLADEQLLLCAGRIDGTALQVVTDKKNALLSSLAQLDKIRLQGERVLRVQSPYEDNTALAEVWQQVAVLGEKLRDKNRHNGMLLSYHLDHNEKALALLKDKHAQTVYGADGQPRTSSISGRRISI
ncbi:flagella synthesis protein FlgN [Dickeya lacustris]|uniref:Flagellar export chaperone FlgN n=1 Tax=Dickeya lacustris TaxID=2259638 RepID=A0ABY8G9G1_9GAMM|nr:flagellar export chaperone FlgN [Dickeya lacustris]WFN56611.1 flagellar export chaperone FlgN [Dickeya lacustris]